MSSSSWGGNIPEREARRIAFRTSRRGESGSSVRTTRPTDVHQPRMTKRRAVVAKHSNTFERCHPETKCCLVVPADRAARHFAQRRQSQNAQRECLLAPIPVPRFAPSREARTPIANAEERGNPLMLAEAPVSKIAPYPFGIIRRDACWTARNPRRR